jgi:hypothetical protein
MALDDRIAAAAPSCYITTLERLLATIGPQDAEQNITGQIAFGMEQTDYVTMRAPRPTLINVGTQDFFDIDGAWTTFREAKRIYGVLEHGERVDLFEFDDKHGWSRPRRESAVRWMRRWLLGRDDAPVEPELAFEKDEVLQCTKTGQVLSDLKGRSVFDLNRAREEELAPGRGRLSREALLAEVGRLLALQRPGAVKAARSREGRPGVMLSVYETEPGLLVPAASLVPPGEIRGAGRHGIVVGAEGKAKARPAADRFLAAGQPAVLLDLRGWGETAGSDFKESFLSILLGRPLLGQRVRDVLGVAGAESHVVGIGAAAPAALHAVALEPRIAELTLEGMVVSWGSVVRTPQSQGQLANVVPGALRVYDLPDLAAAVAPRPLRIRAAVDAAGKPVSQAELEEAYAAARAAYKAAGAEKNLVLEAKP